MSAARRGFALSELLVALVVAGIIGVALTRLVINQARFVSKQDAVMRARGAARAALNVLTAELQMTSGGGLADATPDSITVRVPYAFGIACRKASGNTIVALFPADSAAYASAVPSGFAFQDSVGAYHIKEGASVTATSVGTACSSLSPPIIAGVLTAPGWSSVIGASLENTTTDTAAIGAVVYLYQNVRFAFAPSVELPGRTALWRTVLGTGPREELVVPFDTAAAFTFLVGPSYTVRTTPPALLDSVVGLRIQLFGQSESPAQGSTQPTTFDLTTSILFRNNAP